MHLSSNEVSSLQQVQQIIIHNTYCKMTHHKISDIYNSTAKQEQEESDDTGKKQEQRIVKQTQTYF